MAALTASRVSLLATAALFAAACGKPVGLDAPVTPLVQVNVTAGGPVPDNSDGGGAAPGAGLDGGTAPRLNVALVWAMQWLPEPFCVLAATVPETLAAPPSTVEDIQRVAAAGCRDNFGFVPSRVGADLPLAPNGPTTIPIITLPAADVMVGDLTARIAYASLILYEDGNGNGTLDLRHPQRQRRGGEPINDAAGPADRVWGASFVSMTEPDRRVSYREGGFNAGVAFYPRAGCADPPPSFSILSASGFSSVDALRSILTGQLPEESSCTTEPIDDLVVVELGDPSALSQLACTPNDNGGVTYYREAPSSLDLTNMVWACANFPRLSADDGGVPSGEQLVVASTPDQPCVSTLHYTLRGCNNDPACATPSWDIAATPPSWWPCQTSP